MWDRDRPFRWWRASRCTGKIRCGPHQRLHRSTDDLFCKAVTAPREFCKFLECVCREVDFSSDLALNLSKPTAEAMRISRTDHEDVDVTCRLDCGPPRVRAMEECRIDAGHIVERASQLRFQSDRAFEQLDERFVERRVACGPIEKRPADWFPGDEAIVECSVQFSMDGDRLGIETSGKICGSPRAIRLEQQERKQVGLKSMEQGFSLFFKKKKIFLKKKKIFFFFRGGGAGFFFLGRLKPSTTVCAPSAGRSSWSFPTTRSSWSRIAATRPCTRGRAPRSVRRESCISKSAAARSSACADLFLPTAGAATRAPTARLRARAGSRLRSGTSR